MKKIALGLCVFCMAFGLPFANGEKEGGGKTKNIEISFMLSQAKWKDVFTDMAEQIKKDTGYVIEFQVVPDDQYYPLLKTKLTTGEVPDVFMYNVPMNNVDLNTVNNTVDLGNEPWVSRLSNPNILKDPIDGKIYAMPFESSSFFGPVYYNKKSSSITTVISTIKQWISDGIHTSNDLDSNLFNINRAWHKKELIFANADA